MEEESLFDAKVIERDVDKIALIADIHSNLPALKAVMNDMKSKEFDAIYNLGDLVGYYSQPLEVLDEIVDKLDVSVMGNHDWASIDLNNPLFKIARPAAQESLVFTNKLLREKDKKFIKTLPLKCIVETPHGSLTLVHGHPVTIFDYIYGTTKRLFDKSIQSALNAVKTDYLFVGHSHIQGDFVGSKGKIFVNPGSIGQPRDNDFRSAYAIVDLKNKTHELIRVSYDIESVIKSVHKCHLPSELGSRLKFGI